MIQISSPMKRDFIKETVEAIDDPKFTFVKEEGVNLLFETDAPDQAAAAAKAKSAIKATQIGSVLYFSAKVV